MSRYTSWAERLGWNPGRSMPDDPNDAVVNRLRLDIDEVLRACNREDRVVMLPLAVTGIGLVPVSLWLSHWATAAWVGVGWMTLAVFVLWRAERRAVHRTKYLLLARPFADPAPIAKWNAVIAAVALFGGGAVFLVTGLVGSTSVMAVGLPVALGALLLAVLWRSRIEARLRFAAEEVGGSMCYWCAYPLHGHGESGVCPECGGRFDIEVFRHQWLGERQLP